METLHFIWIFPVWGKSWNNITAGIRISFCTWVRASTSPSQATARHKLGEQRNVSVKKKKFKSAFWKIKLFYKSPHLSNKAAIKSIEITVCISLYSPEKTPTHLIWKLKIWLLGRSSSKNRNIHQTGSGMISVLQWAQVKPEHIQTSTVDLLFLMCPLLSLGLLFHPEYDVGCEIFNFFPLAGMIFH